MLEYPSGDIFKPIELKISTCASVENVVLGSLLAPLISVSTSDVGLANNSNEKLSCEHPEFFFKKCTGVLLLLVLGNNTI